MTYPVYLMAGLELKNNKTSRKPHVAKDPRFNVSPYFSSNDSNLYKIK
jgi:hypothetical protein